MAHGSWTRNQKLVLLFGVFSFLFLSTAVVLAVTSVIWKMQESRGGGIGNHTLRTLTLGNGNNLTATLVLAGIIVLTFLIGIYGFYSGRRPGKANNTVGLVVFNWALFATTIVTIIIGSLVWFFTLTERNDYMEIWLLQTGPTQSFLQDTLSCCGYWNATSAGLLMQTDGFCANIANVTAVQGCVTPVTNFADFFLNNVFTTIYGFTAVQVALFLTTCCLIISRREEERFRRIDEKRGVKGGFV